VSLLAECSRWMEIPAQNRDDGYGLASSNTQSRPHLMHVWVITVASGGVPRLLFKKSQWPLLWSSGQSFWLHNGDVLCFLWGTNWIYICYVEESRPPLCSNGQSSWLHNGDVLCLLWGTNWIYICYVEESRPPLWPSGQSSLLHNGDVLCFLWGTNWIYMLCRRK
jgi:hypothetical protein